jgi:hypothetical protein
MNIMAVRVSHFTESISACLFLSLKSVVLCRAARYIAATEEHQTQWGRKEVKYSTLIPHLSWVRNLRVRKFAGSLQRIKIYHSDPSVDRSINVVRLPEEVFEPYCMTFKQLKEKRSGYHKLSGKKRKTLRNTKPSRNICSNNCTTMKIQQFLNTWHCYMFRPTVAIFREVV